MVWTDEDFAKVRRLTNPEVLTKAAQRDCMGGCHHRWEPHPDNPRLLKCGRCEMSVWSPHSQSPPRACERAPQGRTFKADVWGSH